MKIDLLDEIICVQKLLLFQLKYISFKTTYRICSLSIHKLTDTFILLDKITIYLIACLLKY